jgi:hypothetical protein
MDSKLYIIIVLCVSLLSQTCVDIQNILQKLNYISIQMCPSSALIELVFHLLALLSCSRFQVEVCWVVTPCIVGY